MVVLQTVLVIYCGSEKHTYTFGGCRMCETNDLYTGEQSQTIQHLYSAISGRDRGLLLYHSS